MDYTLSVGSFGTFFIAGIAIFVFGLAALVFAKAHWVWFHGNVRTGAKLTFEGVTIEAEDADAVVRVLKSTQGIIEDNRTGESE